MQHTQINISSTNDKQKNPMWHNVRQGDFVLVKYNDTKLLCIVIKTMEKYEVFALSTHRLWECFDDNELPQLIEIVDTVNIAY